jgi:hypothetical protein
MDRLEYKSGSPSVSMHAEPINSLPAAMNTSPSKKQPTGDIEVSNLDSARGKATPLKAMLGAQLMSKSVVSCAESPRIPSKFDLCADEKGFNEASAVSERQRNHSNTNAGIQKLFNLMRQDLGDQQTTEMQRFYERMRCQIQKLCGPSDSLAPNAEDVKPGLMLGLLEFQKNQIIQSQLFKSKEPFQVSLRPETKEIKQNLLTKSRNNINPYIKINFVPKDGQSVSCLFESLGTKFQEDPAHIALAPAVSDDGGDSS